MNISDHYVIILVHFRQIGYEGVHISYSWHAMLANLYEFMIYVQTGSCMR